MLNDTVSIVVVVFFVLLNVALNSGFRAIFIHVTTLKFI